MFAELATTVGNHAGIKEDGSFHQHGNGKGPAHVFIGPFGLNYAGGYGADYSEFMLQWFQMVQGSYNASAYAQSQFSKLLLDGQEWMIHGTTAPHWDVSVIGREISRPDHHILWDPALLRQIGGDRQKSLDALAARLDGTSHIPVNLGDKHFWKSDYHVYRALSGRYSVSVRTYSNRSLNTECIAHENKLGKHLGTGSTFLYYTGDEYSQTYPVLDYQSIPGTTVERDGNTVCLERTEYPPTNMSCWINCEDTESSGTRSFVGGVSTGVNGLVVFDYAGPDHQSRLQYRKSWFFFDGFHLMLMAGATSNMSVSVSTGLDQKKLQGSVFSSQFDSGKSALGQGVHQFLLSDSAPWWVWHQQTAYVVLSGARTANVSIHEVTENWLRIGIENKTCTQNMFDATIFHNAEGTRLQNASTAVLVVPDVPVELFAVSNYESRMEILAHNTEAMAAAALSSDNTSVVILVALFEETTVEIRTSRLKHLPAFTVKGPPCSLVIDFAPEDNVLKIYVSDPTQTLDQLKLEVSLKLQGQARGSTCSSSGAQNSIVLIDLPKGERAGSTAEIACKMV